MSVPVLQPLARPLRPLVEAFVPATQALDDAGFLRLVARIDERLGNEPPALQRQLKLLVRVLTFLPLFLHLRTMGGLRPEQRVALLHRLQDGPVGKLRLGVWGLRTLVFLGWYGDPQVAASLGWRPTLQGWQGVRGAQDPQPAQKSA